jgi:hypothetical protein
MRSPSIYVNVIQDGGDLVDVGTGWQFFGFSDSRSKNALRLVRKLSLIGTGANNEINKSRYQADDMRARGLLLNESIHQIQHTVLEMCRFTLSVDIFKRDK